MSERLLLILTKKISCHALNTMESNTYTPQYHSFAAVFLCDTLYPCLSACILTEYRKDEIEACIVLRTHVSRTQARPPEDVVRICVG